MNKADFRAQWQNLGYPKGMGSSSFLPPPPSGFIRAYHFTSRKYAEESIKYYRLKVTRFSEANDPFGLLALNCHEPSMRKIAKVFRNKENSKKGILCFTKDWSNPVLWSHYAERHKGICLGYNLKKDTVQEVEYANQRLRMSLPNNIDKISIPFETQKRLCCMKSSKWEYEQELRVFVELKKANLENNNYFCPFNLNFTLAEVIVGPSCEADLSTIKSLMSTTSSSAVVFKARLAYRSFRVVVDGRTKPT